MTPTSVLLLSGGLDSAANLAIASAQAERLICLFVNYGQRAAPSERRAAQKLSATYGAELLEIDLPWLGRLGGSSLTDASTPVPKLGADQLDNQGITGESARSVWVPNRNGVLIQVAAALAERRGVESILVGFNAEEAVTFPDNSEAFMARSNDALALSTRNQVKVRSYTVDLDKTGIVATLRNLPQPFPFEQVWSCYFSGEEPCKQCESCQRFRRATGRLS